MAKVQSIGTEGEGGILEVADTTPYIESGKYKLYTEPILAPTSKSAGIVTGDDITGDFDIDAMFNKTNQQIIDYQAKLAGIQAPQIQTPSLTGIQEAIAKPAEISPVALQQQELLKQEMARRQQAGISEEKAIEQQFAARGEETREAQRIADERAKVGLISILGRGGLESSSSQAVQFFRDLSYRNERTLLDITNAQNEALRVARSAREEEFFTLMNIMIENYKDAEKIGSEVSFDSEEGKGATFYLRVPKMVDLKN